MTALTTLGALHTAISLIAIGSGLAALLVYKEISPSSRPGQLYIFATAITAASGLGIFQHGGFGPPHALSILTLLALTVGMVAATTKLYGKYSRLIEVLSFSTTILFHMIPGVTESLTRLPVDAPLLASAEAPEFKVIYGVVFLLFGIGLALQLRWLRGQKPAVQAA